MANWSDLTFTSGQLDYIPMLNTLRLRSQDVATDVESARGGAASLGAAVLRYVGATADVPMAGYRITGAADAVSPQDYVTLSQLTAASLEASLPAYAAYAGRSIRNNGTLVYWAADSASSQTMAYNGSGQVTGISETVDGYPRSSTFTYNADGTVNTEAVTWHGVTRTRTYIYSSGQLVGSTEV